MEKNKEQDQEAYLTDAYSLFVYAIRTKITRDYYLRRLRSFFDYIELNSSAKIELRCNEFATLATKDHNWTFSKIIGFLQFQKERVQREEITAATLYNFVKALKLFCEMSDIPVSWKKITRGLPVRSFANDRVPTIEEIHKMTEYPDRRMKAIIFTMASSGIRLGAWDYLKWKHVVPLTNDTEDVVAAKITVCAVDIEEYYSFLTPEAYYSLKEWIYLLFRAFTNDYCLPIWASLF